MTNAGPPGGVISRATLTSQWPAGAKGSSSDSRTLATHAGPWLRALGKACADSVAPRNNVRTRAAVFIGFPAGNDDESAFIHVKRQASYG